MNTETALRMARKKQKHASINLSRAFNKPNVSDDEKANVRKNFEFWKFIVEVLKEKGKSNEQF